MKLVRENLNFERTDNPFRNLGIGRRAQIEKWLEEMGVENYTINDDLTIDVNGNVNLNYKNLNSFPSFIKFGKIERYFDCGYNYLTSLKGCPQKVNLGFYCNHNQLISLKGCPKYVGWDFFCINDTKKFTEEEVRKFCDVKRKIEV